MTGTWPASWATGDVVLASEFKKGIGAIFDTTLGAGAAFVDITSIVATYAHLLLVVYARGDTAAANTVLNTRFNNDVAANYDSQSLTGQAASTIAGELFGSTAMFNGSMPANTAGANLFCAHLIFIPNYANTANNKICFALNTLKTGTASTNMNAILQVGFWRSNAAINRITLLPGGGNIVTGSRVTLYGMGA